MRYFLITHKAYSLESELKVTKKIFKVGNISNILIEIGKFFLRNLNKVLITIRERRRRRRNNIYLS